MQKIKKALKKLAAVGVKSVTAKSSPKMSQGPAKKKSGAAGGHSASASAKKGVGPRKAGESPKAQPKKQVRPAKEIPVIVKKKVALKPEKAPEKSAAKAPAGKPTAKPIPAKVPLTKPSKEAAAKEAPAAAKAQVSEAPAGKVVKVGKVKKEQEEAVIVVRDGAAEAAKEEVVLTDAEGRRYCRVKDCDQAATVDAYCRYHYLLYWKNIQNRKKILSEGKLERYIEELTARYPDKYLELLRKDLRSEKDFMAAIQELEIDETGVDNEFEDEQSYLDEVRGMSTESNSDREEEF